MRNQQRVISHQWNDKQDYMDLHIVSSKSNLSLSLSAYIHTGGFLLVSFKRLHLRLEVANIEDFEQVVARARQQPVAVLVPSQAHNGVLVSVARKGKIRHFEQGHTTMMQKKHVTKNTNTHMKQSNLSKTNLWKTSTLGKRS
jgi:hypothetical protein